MDDGAPAAELGRHNKIGAQQRHRHFGKVEIELNSRADKESARQEFAKFPATPCEIKRRQTKNDQRDENCCDHIPLRFITARSFAMMVALALATG